MENFKKNLKQKSSYPALLNKFEKQRHKVQPTKNFDSRRLQMFSGKKGR